MILIRPLIRLLVRVKGRLWVALAALRIYRHLPRFAQRRVRKKAYRSLPSILGKLARERTKERR